MCTNTCESYLWSQRQVNCPVGPLQSRRLTADTYLNVVNCSRLLPIDLRVECEKITASDNLKPQEITTEIGAEVATDGG